MSPAVRPVCHAVREEGKEREEDRRGGKNNSLDDLGFILYLHKAVFFVKIFIRYIGVFFSKIFFVQFFF